MNQWEYFVDCSNPSSGGDLGLLWQQRLNEVGRGGWELVTDHRIGLQYGQVQYVGTFKRLITPERATEIKRQHDEQAKAPTSARVRALADLVARGVVSEEEASRYVSSGRIDDATWTTLKERFDIS